MATINRFEDLPVWQSAREFVVDIYRATDKGQFRNDYPLRDQIRRASISIMANIAEGFDRESKKEFLRFLDYSQASASEVRSHLYLAHDLGYLDEVEFNELMASNSKISKQTGGFRKYLKSDLTGRK